MFLPYKGIFFICAEPFEQIGNTLLTEGPMWNLVKIAQNVTGQPTVIIWTKLVDLESSMLYTKIQPQRFLGSGEDDF